MLNRSINYHVYVFIDEFSLENLNSCFQSDFTVSVLREWQNQPNTRFQEIELQFFGSNFFGVY
jgi:hypothetical protein